MTANLVSKSNSTIGIKEYELSDHLGNENVVVLDRKNSLSNDIQPIIISNTDYYPFGYSISYRTHSTGYRYGFNGQEGDNEIYGDKLNYAFQYRMYDARIGRFWSVDPLKKIYPFYSSYQFAGNSPIWAKELEGLEPGTENWPNDNTGIHNKIAYKKFDKYVTNPLTELLDNGASEEEIQAEADRLAIIYQNKRWLQHSVGNIDYTQTSGNHNSNTTGWEHKTEIIIVAFTQDTKKYASNSSRNHDKRQVYSEELKVNVVPGSTMSVKFEPYAAYNSLRIYTIDSEGKENEILNTGMINDQNTKVFIYEIKIHENKIDKIRIEVEHSKLDPIQDNWNLNMELTTPKKFDPHSEKKMLKKDEKDN